jgi:DNA-binding CsgD family transcriptional regulator
MGRPAAALEAIAPVARMVARQAPSVGRDAWVVGASLIASACADAGDAEKAAEWYEPLTPFASQFAPNTIPALELGRICVLNARWDDALAWLDTAREMAARVEGRPFAALAAYESGRAYAGRGTDGDAPRAQAAFAEAASMFDTLEMLRYAASARHEAEVAAGTYRAGGLTPRETEIVRLIALGHTNRAIAERLVLSENTVIRHVANIFNKLGVENRAAATAWAARAGITAIEPSG